MINITKVKRNVSTFVESDGWSLKFTPVSRWLPEKLDIKVRLDIKGDTQVFLTLEELDNIIEALVEMRNEQ